MDPISLALLGLTIAQKFVDPAIRDAVKDVNAAVKLFVDELNTLPGLAKPDGTPWTVEDVLAARALLQETNDAIRREAGGG